MPANKSADDSTFTFDTDIIPLSSSSSNSDPSCPATILVTGVFFEKES